MSIVCCVGWCVSVHLFSGAGRSWRLACAPLCSSRCAGCARLQMGANEPIKWSATRAIARWRREAPLGDAHSWARYAQCTNGARCGGAICSAHPQRASAARKRSRCALAEIWTRTFNSKLGALFGGRCARLRRHDNRQTNAKSTANNHCAPFAISRHIRRLNDEQRKRYETAPAEAATAQRSPRRSVAANGCVRRQCCGQQGR